MKEHFYSCPEALADRINELTRCNVSKTRIHCRIFAHRLQVTGANTDPEDAALVSMQLRDCGLLHPPLITLKFCGVIVKQNRVYMN